MVFAGRVQNGQIVIDGAVALPEGAKVHVEVVEAKEVHPENRTLLERLEGFVGILDDLPEDLARNHDHYLYGTPKLP